MGKYNILILNSQDFRTIGKLRRYFVIKKLPEIKYKRKQRAYHVVRRNKEPVGVNASNVTFILKTCFVTGRTLS